MRNFIGGGRLRTLVTGALLASLAMTAVAGPAMAAKGRPGGGSAGGNTLTLRMVRDADGSGTPNYRDHVGFTISATATDRPFVGLRCYQGSAFVLDGYVGYFPDTMSDDHFVLYTQYWNPSVAATCTARLFYFDRRGRETVLATTSFSVAP